MQLEYKTDLIMTNVQIILQFDEYDECTGFSVQ